MSMKVILNKKEIKNVIVMNNVDSKNIPFTLGEGLELFSIMFPVAMSVLRFHTDFVGSYC